MAKDNLEKLSNCEVCVVHSHPMVDHCSSCCFRTTPYDITLLKEISWYEKNANALVGKLAWKAFSHHLWYFVEKIMPLSLFSDAVTNKEKEEIVEKLKSIEDSSSFSNRQGTGFGRPNFPTLNKDVSGRKFLYFVAYLCYYHEKAINAL